MPDIEWVYIAPHMASVATPTHLYTSKPMPVQMAYSYGLRLTILVIDVPHGFYVGYLERPGGRYKGPFTAGTLEHKSGLGETELRDYLCRRAQEEGAMPKNSRWVKIYPHPGCGWAWFLDEEDEDKDYYLNISGGHFPKRGSVALHSCYADDPAKLDWTGSYLTQNSSAPTYGWLSPEGEHHTCESQCHVDFAYLVLKSAEEILEAKGWIKTFRPTDVAPWILSELAPTIEPTQAQRDWLFDHGFGGDSDV